MSETPARSRGFVALVRRVRPLHLAPVLAFLALAAWAFASPVGAGPDDDYHLVSTWCANGGSEQCEPGSESRNRDAAWGLEAALCYAQHAERSAECQGEVMPTWADRLIARHGARMRKLAKRTADKYVAKARKGKA